MDAARIAQTLTYVPQREPRSQTGTVFALEGTACRHAEKLAHLAALLQWLSPLSVLTLQDQQALGLVGPNGRALHAGDEDPELSPEETEEAEQEAEDELV